MKICSKCKQPKPADRKKPYCVPCTRIYDREMYAKNAARERARKSGERRRGAQRTHTILLEAMKDGCVLCPEKDIRCLTFDHVDRKNKKFIIADIRGNIVSEARLRAELAKCRVLCANCHHKHTAKQFDYYSNYV